MTLKEKLALGAIFLYAALARLFAITQTYHQDEYKWALEVDPSTGMTNPVHPALALNVYKYVGAVIGYDHLRIVPAILGLVTLGLIFCFSRRWWGSRVALAIAAVYAVDFYALLGSVQIDIDGSFLPLVTLLAFASYIEWLQAPGSASRRWLILLCIALTLGFVTKLSFVLVPASIVVHYAWKHPDRARAFLIRRSTLSAIGAAAACVVLTLAYLWTQVPFLAYVGNFTALQGRDFGELAFLTAKGMLYLSPLIACGIVLSVRYWRDLSLWFVFLGANIFFYFVLFDFTHRAFDRYLMFLILPGAILTGYALERLSRAHSLAVPAAVTTAVLAAATYIVFALPHNLVPLIPKAGFVHAFLSGHWNFLLPLTGGSGPLGFYMPVDGMALLWTVAGIGLVLALLSRTRRAGLAVIVAVSLVYNVCITHEYLTGRFYGSATTVVRQLTHEIVSDQSIPPVITYNDIGAYELLTGRKYAARFYPHDQFIADNVVKFAEKGTGYFLVVNVPEINLASGYARFFGSCQVVASRMSGHIIGRILDCRGVPSSLIVHE